MTKKQIETEQPGIETKVSVSSSLQVEPASKSSGKSFGIVDAARVADEVKRVTRVCLLANVLLSIGKMVAGIVGASHAVFADGIHSLSDCVTDIVILVGVRHWSKPADDCHPYGHRRIETLITIFIGFALVAAALGLCVDGITSFGKKPENSPGLLALIAAIGSIGSKEILFQWTNKKGQAIGSSALKANAWHQRTDAISSIPVAVAVAVSWAFPNLYFVDSAGALLVSLFIFYMGFRIIIPGLSQLVDKGISSKDRLKIQAIAQTVDGVKEVHQIRSRYGGEFGIYVDMHVLVEKSLTVLEGHNIADAVQCKVQAHHPEVIDVVVHIEPY